MNLDQMAREAVGDAQQAGRKMPIVPMERLRRRRLLRSVAPLIAVGLATWVAILVISLPSENATPPADGEPTPTSIVTATTTTVQPTTTAVPTTTAPQIASPPDAEWVRGTVEQIFDDQGEVLHEFPQTVLFGRNTAWDGGDGFVALTWDGLIWMRPDGLQTIAMAQGSILEVVVTEAGAHVVGVMDAEDRTVRWVEMETGNEVEAPTEATTIDGKTFSVGDRSVTIEEPDWSDVERDEAGGPIPPFDLADLVVTENGTEVLRLPVGSEQRPYMEIHDFDGRRLVIAALPQEPAVPPSTIWIIDLECADCTQRLDTPSLEYLDLIGVLPPEGDVVQPVLP